MQSFKILVSGADAIEFTGTLAQAKKVIQGALIAYGAGDYIRTKYAFARVYFGEDQAECSLTPTKRLRFEVQERRVVKAPILYGTFVEVVSVHGKYDDSMGAYEVLTVKDDKGQEYSVGNMYDTTSCFRKMSKEQRLAYAQANV